MNFGRDQNLRLVRIGFIGGLIGAGVAVLIPDEGRGYAAVCGVVVGMALSILTAGPVLRFVHPEPIPVPRKETFYRLMNRERWSWCSVLASGLLLPVLWKFGEVPLAIDAVWLVSSLLVANHFTNAIGRLRCPFCGNRLGERRLLFADDIAECQSCEASIQKILEDSSLNQS